MVSGFAGRHFDPASGEIQGPEGAVRLPPQPAALLAHLLAANGEVVSRDAIQEELWPGGRVEFDQGIAFAMRQIRKALGQRGDSPTLIETLPRRGFRVLVSVEIEEGYVESGIPSSATGTVAGVSTVIPVPRWNWRQTLVWSTIGATMVCAAFWWTRPSVASDLPPLLAVFQLALGDEPSGDLRALGRRLGDEMTSTFANDFSGRARIAGPAATESLLTEASARDALEACLTVSGALRPTQMEPPSSSCK